MNHDMDDLERKTEYFLQFLQNAKPRKLSDKDLAMMFYAIEMTDVRDPYSMRSPVRDNLLYDVTLFIDNREEDRHYVFKADNLPPYKTFEKIVEEDGVAMVISGLMDYGANFVVHLIPKYDPVVATNDPDMPEEKLDLLMNNIRERWEYLIDKYGEDDEDDDEDEE